jgi:hypothetical protein
LEVFSEFLGWKSIFLSEQLNEVGIGLEPAVPRNSKYGKPSGLEEAFGFLQPALLNISL